MASMRNNAIYPKVFVAKGQEYVFKKKDPIFSLSRGVARGLQTEVCFYCREAFRSERYRHWCDFCGQNMCLKCSRYRHFEIAEPDGHNRGEIDLLCLKKFHIRDMVLSAQETCKRVEKDINNRRQQM